ncbi:MAG: metallophosphoesterase [Bacteroidetes bacterium]|nr:metallophosphoesterase [Bacteroidota bacterium]
MKKLILLFAAIFTAPLISPAQFTFVAVSDLHVSDTIDPDSDFNAQYFRCAMQEFDTLHPKPSFVTASGDISDVGNRAPEGMYPTLTRYLFPPTLTNPGIGDYFIDAAQTIPIYFTPGNHEYWTSFEPNGIPVTNDTIAYYTKYITPDTDYVITNSISVVVFLRSGHDTPYTYGPDSIKGSGFSNEQCSWLRNILALNGSKRKIIIMHHPAVNAVGTNSDGSPNTTVIPDTAYDSFRYNRTTFLNICDSNHVDVVLNGHEHQNVVVNRRGDTVSENWPGGTRYVQTAAAFNRSYRVITVDPAFVTVSRPLRSCNSVFGENELIRPFNISVYPNPALDKLTIACSQDATMEISTIDGQVIKTIRSRGLDTTIGLEALPAGVYVVKALTARGILVRKFIKQ